MSCTNCLTDQAKRKGLCNACYQHARRNQGTPRPQTNIIRHNTRRHENQAETKRRSYYP